MNELAYERCVAELQNDKQAMVFVHSRKDTNTTANKILEWATQKHTLHLFASPVDHPRYAYFKQRVQRSHNLQIQNLFKHGIGIHHAGLRRSDR